MVDFEYLDSDKWLYKEGPYRSPAESTQGEYERIKPVLEQMPNDLLAYILAGNNKDDSIWKVCGSRGGKTKNKWE